MSKWVAFKQALLSGGWTGIVNTLVALGVTLGLLTTNQSNAVSALIAGCATVLNLLVATVHTFQMARQLRMNAKLLDDNRALHSRLLQLNDG